MSLRAIIVDDEPLARSRLKRQLASLGIEVVAEGYNGQDAIELVLANQVEFLFIDIQMPVKDGLQAVNEISQKVSILPAIIFCTAHDEFALEAFNTNALAYLLKPANIKDIEAAITKATVVSNLKIVGDDEHLISEKTLSIHFNGALQKTTLNQFTHFYAVDKSVFAGLVSGENILIDVTLKALNEKFDGQLVRIHRSILANKSHFHRLVKDESGSIAIVLSTGGEALKVSRRHLSEVKKCFE